MIIVIIAGGSGTRLWPLSTSDYPKHLLKINGDPKSLLQHTYERARRITDKIYIVSEASHIVHVKEHLKGLADDYFIVEPGRRGTANCIISALAYIGKTNDHDEAIVAIHSDHFIRDIRGFVNSFQIADKISKSQKKIVLIGAEPDYPATGFGYIEKGEVIKDNNYLFKVKSFKEKPDFELAKQYLNSGNYLWNCGYFVGSINTFKDKMEHYAPDLLNNYLKLYNASEADNNDIYLSFENQSIDYSLIEKVKDLLVVPASFDWLDIGSYNDLHKIIGSDENGNHIDGNIVLDNINNSLIMNEESKPVVCIGLDNVVIINSKDGILVSRKDLSQKVGDLVKTLKV